MADPVIEQEIPNEAGKRNPYQSVRVGLCSNFSEAARMGMSPTTLCAAFTMTNPVIGDENNGIVLLTKQDLEKAVKNGMGGQVAGINQAMQMMQNFGRKP